MANIFQSCKAASAALEAIFARFLLQMSRRAGIPAERLAEATAAGTAAKVSSGKEDLAVLIKECRRVGASESEPASALELARKLARMRELMGGTRRLTPGVTKSGGR
jgi:CRP-like cAMP-binding protein